MGGTKKVSSARNEDEDAGEGLLQDTSNLGTRREEEEEDGFESEVEELPEDTVMGAVREAGFGTLLMSALVAGYSVWYAGVAHPSYRKPRIPLSTFPPQRRVHHHADQRALKSRWVHATHEIDLTGFGFTASPEDAPVEGSSQNAVGDEAPHYSFDGSLSDDDGGGSRRRTTNDVVVFKHGPSGRDDGHARLRVDPLRPRSRSERSPPPPLGDPPRVDESSRVFSSRVAPRGR